MIRVTVEAEHLAGVLRAGVSQNKGTLPILAHALIEADAEGLRITTTDLQTLIATRVGAIVTEHGAVCAQVDLLAGACIGGGSVELIEDKPGVMVVKRGKRSRCQVPTLPPGEWPVSDKIVWTDAGVDSVVLGRAIAAVLYATDRNDIRPYCSGVCLTKTAAYGANGHRMAAYSLDYAGPDLVIPTAAAGALARMLSDGGAVELGTVGTNPIMAIACTTDLERIEVKTLQHNGLPQFGAMFPIAAPNGTMVVDVAAMRTTGARLKGFCERAIVAKGKTSISRGARVVLENGAARVEDAPGENCDEIAQEHMHTCSGSISAGLDLALLVSAVDAIDAEKLELSQYGDHDSRSSMFLLQAQSDQQHARHLIMGMTL